VTVPRARRPLDASDAHRVLAGRPGRARELSRRPGCRARRAARVRVPALASGCVAAPIRVDVERAAGGVPMEAQ
jgi:hypothetical protein